ncbi:MAG: hypothetical protein WKG07_11535 [Hymenobacter sp.]
MQNHRAAVEHLKKGDHERPPTTAIIGRRLRRPCSKAHRGSRPAPFARHGDHEPLHAHEQGGAQ